MSSQPLGMSGIASNHERFPAPGGPVCSEFLLLGAHTPTTQEVYFPPFSQITADNLRKENQPQLSL